MFYLLVYLLTVILWGNKWWWWWWWWWWYYRCINSDTNMPTRRLFWFRLAVAPRSGRRADDSRCWHHCDVSNNYCRTVSKTGRRRRILSICNSFWVLVWVVIVNNCKPARPPLGGHQEVNTHAYTIYWHSRIIYTLQIRRIMLCHKRNRIRSSDHWNYDVLRYQRGVLTAHRTTVSQ